VGQRRYTDAQKTSNAARSKRWADNNRDRLNASVRRYRAKRYAEQGRWTDEGPKAKLLREWMVELKSKPCYDCHQSFQVCCMDFAHRDPSSKKYNIGSMFAHHYGRALIQKELDKCDLVCANCHRIRTRNEKTGHGRIHRIS